MATGLNVRPINEIQGSWQMDHDSWFTESTKRLRQRTAREGAWVRQPSRETVERIIQWFQGDSARVQQ